MVGIGVDVEGFVVGLSFRVTSRKLQILRFALIKIFSPYFLNSRVMSFLVRSDCGPLAYIWNLIQQKNHSTKPNNNTKTH